MTGRERVTAMHDFRILCREPADGFALSVAPLLLSHLVLAERRRRCSFVELGAGTGFLSILLARCGFGPGVALELDGEACACLDQNLLANGVEDRVVSCRGDLRRVSELLPAGSARMVVSNPPFHAADSGRRAREAAVAAGRHELSCSLTEVVQAARYLLPPRGRFLVIYPVARLPELLAALAANKLHPCRLQLVHPREGRPADSFLLEAAKAAGPQLSVASPLVVHDGPGPGYGRWYPELVSRVERQSAEPYSSSAKPKTE